MNIESFYESKGNKWLLCAKEIYQSIFVVRDKNFISVSIFVASLITKRPEEEKNWSRKIARNDFQFPWKRIINGNPLQRYGFSPQLFPHMLDHGNRKYIAAKNKGRIIFHSLYRLFKRFLGMLYYTSRKEY